MDLTNIHKSLLRDLPGQIDLWSLTSPENRVAVLGWGQPTTATPAGHVVIASECRSILAALDWMTQRLAAPTASVEFAGWFPPFTHVIAIERESPSALSTVGWSNHSRHATIGRLFRPPHPEFPVTIDMLQVGESTVVQSRRDMTLTLIANLAHLDIFLPGLT